MICIFGTFFFLIKICILEVIAMEIFHNIVTLKTLTYNYGKTVFSEENVRTPTFFGDRCGLWYVKCLKII